MKKLFTILATVLLTSTTFAQVGIGTSTPHTSAALDIDSTTKGLLIPRMTNDQRTRIPNPVAGLQVFVKDFDGGKFMFYDGTKWGTLSLTPVITPPVLSIGDTYQGGVIFYILKEGDTGYKAGQTQGLIAAPTDLPKSEWGCMGTGITGTSIAIGTGVANTDKIVTGCTSLNIAAERCKSLTIGEYSDWYLPSKDELKEMYGVLGNTNSKRETYNFITGPYWSSTQYNNRNAWRIAFTQGGEAGRDKEGPDHHYNVRAVRSF